MNDLVEHVIRAGWPKHVMQKSKLWDLRFCFAKKVWKKVAEPSWMIIQVFKFFERPPLILKRIEIIHLPSLNIGLASIRAFASATSALENHLKSFCSRLYFKDTQSLFRIHLSLWKTLDHLPKQILKVRAGWFYAYLASSSSTGQGSGVCPGNAWRN